MTLTIYTLFNEFPLVFASRVVISLLILLCLIFFAFRFYICKKLNKLQFISSIILSAYFVVMLYFTVLGRYSQEYYRSQIMIFELHKRLCNSFNYIDLQQLIVNILMFIPIGFMLPLILKHKHKYVLSMAISLLITSGIEIAQFFSRTGTFETDDILNNIIGVAVGLMLFIIGKKFMLCSKIEN